MIKIALFAVVQVVFYLEVAFVVWDLAWLINMGNQTTEVRFNSAFAFVAWGVATAFSCVIWIKSP